MKKFLLIACLCSLSIAGFAQEEKPASEQPASPQIEALQLASNLVTYGYANSSATALIEAAKILSETPTQAFAGTKESADQQAVADKGKTICLDPAKLLADAKKFAGKDKTVLAYAAQVEKGLKAAKTRGPIDGPKMTTERVKAHSTDVYRVTFVGGELAEVLIYGDGDNDLDLYIYDENGNLVDSDIDYTDKCFCQWVPAWTGVFVIKVVNRGDVYSDYIIAID